MKTFTIVLLALLISAVSFSQSKSVSTFEEYILEGKKPPNSDIQSQYQSGLRTIVWTVPLVKSYEYSDEIFDQLGYDKMKSNYTDKESYRNCSKGITVDVGEWEKQISITMHWYGESERKQAEYLIFCKSGNSQEEDWKQAQKIWREEGKQKRIKDSIKENTYPKYTFPRREKPSPGIADYLIVKQKDGKILMSTGGRSVSDSLTIIGINQLMKDKTTGVYTTRLEVYLMTIEISKGVFKNEIGTNLYENLEEDKIYELKSNGKLRRKKINDAILHLNKKIEENPFSLNAYFLRGNLRISELNDTKGAIEDFLKVVELDPEHLQVYCRLSEIYSTLFTFKTAAIYAAKAVEINDQDEVAASSLALIHIHFRMYDLAKKDLNRITQFRFWSREFYNCLAYLRIQEGDYEHAVELFTVSIDNCHYGKNDKSYLNRGLLKIENFYNEDEGVEDLKKAYELGELGAYIYLMKNQPGLFSDKMVSEKKRMKAVKNIKSICFLKIGSLN